MYEMDLLNRNIIKRGFRRLSINVPFIFAIAKSYRMHVLADASIPQHEVDIKMFKRSLSLSVAAISSNRGVFSNLTTDLNSQQDIVVIFFVPVRSTTFLEL